MKLEIVNTTGTDTSKPLTLQKRTNMMRKWIDLQGCSILDAGCGAGGYVEYLCALGAEAKGVEYDTDKVDQWLRAHPGDDRIKQGDLGGLEYGDAVFDAVLLNETLEHVPDDNLALTEVHRVIKPGGFLFLFSPNRLHPFETHGFISDKLGHGTGVARTFLLPYLPVSMLPHWLHPWARNYWPHELRDLVKSRGFQIVEHSIVWQTLENNSGYQPKYIMRLVPFLRKVINVAEHLPLIKNFGVSQFIVACKIPQR